MNITPRTPNNINQITLHKNYFPKVVYLTYWMSSLYHSFSLPTKFTLAFGVNGYDID